MFGKILVASDSNTDRSIIKNMLSAYNILTVDNGEETLNIIDKNLDIDLILLDLNLPIIDGFQVLKALNSNEKYRAIKTIILSNYNECSKEIRGLKLGAVDYIRKPIVFESLITRIKLHSQLSRIQKQTSDSELTLHNIIYKTIFEQFPIGIAFAYNCYPNDLNDNNHVSINPMFEQIVGRKKEEMLKLGWARITHPEDLEENLDKYNELIKGNIKSFSMEKRFVKPNGTVVWVDMTVAKLNIVDNSEDDYVCIVQDISERKEQENKLKFANEHHELTGLYNHRFFKELLVKESILGKNSKRAILLINLKKINSLSLAYGHNFSRRLIIELAKKLYNLKDSNRMLFQISMDKFAFYITEYDNNFELSNLCDDIFNIVKEVKILNNLGCYIGILEIEKDTWNSESIIKDVSIAAEHVDSKNIFDYCYYDEDLKSKVTRENDIKDELFKIISDEKDKCIYLQYQPVLDIRTDKIVAFETLARFNSKKLGLVSPGEFIPIAEEMQFIVPIGTRVIKMACEFIKKLELAGYENIVVCINISGIQLLRDEFIDELKVLIEDTKINPQNLGMEITESVFFDNLEIVNEKLRKLQEMGIGISIDDFGTGYSSLSREYELNVNCLKIDKFFIDKLPKKTPAEAITADIISIAHKLGHIVVAEGVEYEEQYQYLADNNCDYIQGYLFSRPIDEDDAFEILKNPPNFITKTINKR